MTQINLLPWREQARQGKKTQFIVILVSFIILTLFLVLIAYFYLDSLISSQKKINDFLQTSLDQENSQLLVLHKKKQEQDAVDKQLHFIFGLRDSSYKAVRLLDELTRVVPDSVLLSKITREGDKITIKGKAQSNLQVTLFLKNIAKSPIFTQPILAEINGQENNSEDQKYFLLKFEQRESNEKN